MSISIQFYTGREPILQPARVVNVLKMIDLLDETMVSVFRVPEIPLWTFSFSCLLLEMSRITRVQINVPVKTSTFPSALCLSLMAFRGEVNF